MMTLCMAQEIWVELYNFSEFVYSFIFMLCFVALVCLNLSTFFTLFLHRERILTKGDIPHRNSGSCGLLHEDFLYIFGG